MAGRHATRLGYGSYLARHASYATRYTTPDAAWRRHLLVCRAIVGAYCQGHESMHVPPVRLAAEPHRLGEVVRYDSTVDDTSNPEIYVAFHDAQIYPDYLLTFVEG